MDDKLLGEKVQCYISDDSDTESDTVNQQTFRNSATVQQCPEKAQTGPKGVIEDYNEYQRTGEVRRPLANETSSSSGTDLESDEDADEIFRAYRANQIDRLRGAEKVLALQKDVAARQEYKSNTHTAHVIDLNEENYVETVESKGHVVMVLYDALDDNSSVVIKALTTLSRQLPHVAFCRAERRAITDACSNLLRRKGLPCVIGNYDGRQIGAIVWPEIADELGEDFGAEQFLSLLRERNFL